VPIGVSTHISDLFSKSPLGFPVHGMKFSCRLLIASLLPVLASAQGFDNSSLTGSYHFVHLLASVSAGGQATDARNLGGSITFDGNGGYTFQGRLGQGTGLPAPSEGAGTYSVQANAFLILTNPIENGLQINGRIGAGSEVVLGASTEATSNSYDLFVAVKAPDAGITNSALNGAYSGASLALPNGSDSALTTAFLRLAADGSGAFSEASVIGHGVNAQDVNVEQNVTNATYALNGDGTGTASFGSSASLVSGDRDIFVSSGGNYLIGFSTGAGGREILLAVKNFSTSANNATWNGNYWIAELVRTTEQGTHFYSTAVGAMRANGAGAAPHSQRLRPEPGLSPLDSAFIQFYRIDADSTGLLAPFPDALVTNMATGAPSGGIPQAFVGGLVLAQTDISSQHGLFFGVRMPEISGDGVFLSPLGVVNAASFAPPTYPVSGGTLISVFGSGLAPSAEEAQGIPYPIVLGGVSVTVNGVAAPLLFVSGGQINLQVPFGVSGSSATIIVVNNNGAETGSFSNEVTVRLATSSPGIFSVDGTGFGPGTVVHADFSLVSEAAPASAGETVIIFLTGLGQLSPPIPDGAAAPVDPLSRTTDSDLQVLVNGEVGTVLFSGAAPGFVGLYQINMTIPNPVVAGTASVAIFTANAFSCFTDIAIGF
jgi:uncharacterized protein (TIGR03437 family)